MIRFKLLPAILLLFVHLIFAQPFLKHRNTLQLTDWKFFKGDVSHAEKHGNNPAGSWQNIKVPHTWNAEDVLTEGEMYYQGIGWYRTQFDISEDDPGKRYFVRFEGVCQVKDVYFNGKYLGQHRGGYSAFCFELSQYIQKGQSNTLAVKVDNSTQPDVAPSGTDLYPLFGGIYRPVTLFSTDDICISPLEFASPGIYLKPLSVSADSAKIAVDVLLDYQPTPLLERTSSALRPPKGKKGNGLYGEYFDNADFKGKPVYKRVDESINFIYHDNPPVKNLPKDYFSIRWTGRFIPPASGDYVFYVTSDDGSRLYLNDKKVIDNWGSHAPSEKSCKITAEKDEVISLLLEYNEHSQGAMIQFGWKYYDTSLNEDKFKVNVQIKDHNNILVSENSELVMLAKNHSKRMTQNLQIINPHLWDARRDPYLYSVHVQLFDEDKHLLDQVDQPLGLRTFHVDKDQGFILNDKSYPLYGICRHQEWEGLGPALTDAHHEKDMEIIKEMGASSVRLAHYQQADKIYSLCDEKGLVVWAEIPNTPTYRTENPAYLKNCQQQLTELILQNYNHPSICFWGLYNEIPISADHVKTLHETAKTLDPYRLTTQADYTAVNERHFETDVAAWNWYFGWYYGDYLEYNHWFDRLHEDYPKMKGGLSEYGAGGCVTQQQDPPEAPNAWNGRFYPEQYQRLYHEKVWMQLKDRPDIWCKYIWNSFDFSWTGVRRGDRDFINHKGLVTHDRRIKKDAFYFYKANWSDEPVLYILSRRYTERTESVTPVAVYTNLDKVQLYLNGELISEKAMSSDIHKIQWNNVQLRQGTNQISVIGEKDDKIYTDACEWQYHPSDK